MENTELASEVEAMADAEEQDQAYDQSIPAPERTSQSRWWVSMSSKQRDNYLARRRANYHRHRGQTSNHEGNTRVSKRMRLSHICQMSDNVADRNATNNDDDIVVNEETFENVVPQNDMPGSSSVAKACDRPRRCKSHNCARNFHENIGMRKYHLPTPKTCPHCHARLFHHESKDMCCLNGKIVIL
ncbi:uncharacterized protein LOC133710911 [Rosa rugosa]|uniref:uncharacterized protein LOC133710911 n=1 Tax=Rosa rugosa TaxID=74645 RepID=UPI002B40D839|nr:uncharacterized protein LOC133710911 [Rosa rugosa]